MISERRREKITGTLARRQPGLTVVMENIHDPHNVSAMLRSADAVGIHEVQLMYTGTQFPKIGKKSSSSANKWVSRRRFDSVHSCYDKLHSEGFIICATALNDRAEPLYRIDMTKKIALVFGNEHAGVSEEAAAAADRMVMIPMMGMIQSLNVSVACAVCLYEALRQRMGASMYDSPGFPPEEFERLIGEWSRK